MNRLHLTLFTLVLAATAGAGARAENSPSAKSSHLPEPFMAIASSSLPSTASVKVPNPGTAASNKKALVDALPSWQNLSQFLASVPAGIDVDIPFLPRPTPVPATEQTPIPSLTTEPLDAKLNRSLTAFRKAQQALYRHSYQEAMIEINRAIGKMPNVALFHALKGSIFYSAGDYNAARIAWNRSLALDPTVPLVRKMLERIADNREKLR